MGGARIGRGLVDIMVVVESRSLDSWVADIDPFFKSSPEVRESHLSD